MRTRSETRRVLTLDGGRRLPAQASRSFFTRTRRRNTNTNAFMSEQIKWMNKSCLCHVLVVVTTRGVKHKSCAVGIIAGASDNDAAWKRWKVNNKKRRRLTSNFGASLYFSGNDADRTCLSRSALLCSHRFSGADFVQNIVCCLTFFHLLIEVDS